MRVRTAVTFGITGAVLTFAVRGRLAAVDVPLAGVILMLTGAAGLWPHGGKTWLHIGRIRLRQYVDDAAPAQGVRVPLGDLLDGGSRPRADGRHVWAAQAGHEERMRAFPGPQEVTWDGEASERAKAG